jgi:hypothetical protein
MAQELFVSVAVVVEPGAAESPFVVASLLLFEASLFEDSAFSPLLDDEGGLCPFPFA